MRCVAFGCNKTHADGVSFHIFPSEEKIRRLWTLAVQKTRASWKPSKYSALCSNHFEDDCYEDMWRLGKDFGVTGKINRRLKRNSVPTIFPNPKTPTNEKKRRSTAFEKREHNRILQDIFNEPANDHNTNDEDLNVPLGLSEPLSLTAEKETQTTSELQHCCCCLRKQPKSKLKNSSFQWNGHPRMADKAMQIFPEDKDKDKGHLPPSIDVSSESEETEVEYDDEDDIEDDDDDDNDDEHDPDFIPQEEDEDESDLDLNVSDVHNGGRKFLVCEKQLLEAFSTCLMCRSHTSGRISAIIGTFCRVKQVCSNCNFERTWDSQPLVNNVPVGNLLLSAAMLLSGSCISKSLRLFKYLNMSSISSQTFHQHQKYYLLPSIQYIWDGHQERSVAMLQADDSVALGGDGRADSPGHSAKYGSYSLMDLKRSQIVNVQIVQSNEVGSSYHMEKEGLVRAVKYLRDNGIEVETLVTDRHTQIKKWVKENLPNTKHKFDLWHIAKGITKKLEKIAKLVSCRSLKPWIRSISNHLYWCATSTVDGDGETMLAKWKSIGRHIQNIHEGHGDKFPECAHGKLEGKERKKKWMITGSSTLLKTLAVINDHRLCKDLVFMSEKYQTSKLEAFHSTLNHFAPKMIHFSYWGQTCRTLLAAMHFNENADREQAITEEGNERFRIAFPKFKKGGYSVRTIYKDPTFNYADDIICRAFALCSQNLKQPLQETPGALCSNFVHPDKDEAVASHCSRFI